MKGQSEGPHIQPGLYELQRTPHPETARLSRGFASLPEVPSPKELDQESQGPPPGPINVEEYAGKLPPWYQQARPSPDLVGLLVARRQLAVALQQQLLYQQARLYEAGLNVPRWQLALG